MGFTYAQNSPVPNNRERLKERLQILLKSDEQKDYEKLYELLAEEQRNSYGSKGSFIKFKTTADSIAKQRLTKFIAREFSLTPLGNEAIIIGCGEYVRKGKKKLLESQVEAVYENNDWYFRSLIGVSDGFGTKAKKCSMKQ